MAVDGLILFPGASGKLDHPLFLELAQRLSIPVATTGFGRQNRMPKVVPMVNDAVARFAEEWSIPPARIAIGGRSMGGRAASIAVAEGLEVAALVLLSYPLHPPGKPDSLRVEHFGGIDVPVLLVQGDRDPFGKPGEFAEHLQAIPGEVTQHWLTGPRSGHDPKGREDEIVPAVATWLAQA
jgi:predicted alpha/beta-hydrolase family hydrolase